MPLCSPTSDIGVHVGEGCGMDKSASLPRRLWSAGFRRFSLDNQSAQCPFCGIVRLFPRFLEIFFLKGSAKSGVAGRKGLKGPNGRKRNFRGGVPKA